MDIDLPEVVAEVRAAFERYETALVSNDVAALDAMFHEDARTIRYGGAENLYGYMEIRSFRAARSPAGLTRSLSKTVITTYGYLEIRSFRAARSAAGLMRSLSKTVITTYGRDHGIASTLFYRASAPGKVGRQMQTWVRFPQGWRVVAAHVSLIDEPA